MNSIRRIFRTLFRLIVVWIVDAISLLLTSLILPGVTISAVETAPAWVAALAAAFLLGIVNLLLRPLILLLALPLGFFVTFGVGFLVNALVLLIACADAGVAGGRPRCRLHRRPRVVGHQHHPHRRHSIDG